MLGNAHIIGDDNEINDRYIDIVLKIIDNEIIALNRYLKVLGFHFVMKI